MGVGWDYFNNVCKAIKAAYSFLVGLVCLVVVFLVGRGVMQAINANRPDPTLVVAPTTTPAVAPIVKPNPQFKTPGAAGAVAPANMGVPAAPTAAVAPNPQFQPSRGSAPTNAGTPAAPAALKPNPQFAPIPQFH